MDIFVTTRKHIVMAVLATVFCCILMVAFPSTALYSARKGIRIWTTDVLPALLPFFICANFLQNIGITRFLKSGIFPFAMSVLSGYPMGAGIIGKLKRNGEITLDEARKMISYCSTSGPAFMISAVGAGMLGSGKAGMIIAAAHYLGALFNGFIYGGLIPVKHRNKSISAVKDNEGLCERYDLQEALTNAIVISLKSLGIILSYIVMFMFITDVMTVGSIFDGFEKPWIEALFKGMIEMTVGCEEAARSSAISSTMKITLCSFIISWGGLSVMGQTMSMLGGTGISVRYIFITKFTHALFSAAVAFVIALFML